MHTLNIHCEFLQGAGIIIIVIILIIIIILMRGDVWLRGYGAVSVIRRSEIQESAE